jgi:S-adenosylhomocysteine hydrolase
MDAIVTSLGYPLIKNDTAWEIDLTGLRIFTGLSVLATIIAENIIEQVENNPGDISFLYKINPNINPELIRMKVSHIQVYARAGILKDVSHFKDEFHGQIRTIFGTFQRPEWWKHICPETSGENGTNALIFPFHHACANEDLNYQYLLERCENANIPGEYFFRLSVETYPESYLDITSISHVLVDDLKTRVFISGSTKMAESIRDGILNSCNRGLKIYSRENRPHSHLFEQLEHTLLGRLKQINFYWEKWFNLHIHKVDQTTRLIIFKKLFLALEADALCDTLKHGETVNIRVGEVNFMLYLSQLGRVLNVSINLPRKVFHIDYYLERMPALKSLAHKHGHSLDFTDVRIFLIHHITSEIIAFIAALKQLHTDSISVLFVKYGGLIPSAYLDALLENPSDFLCMTGLARKMSEKNKDYYTLASYFSDISSLEKIDTFMEKEQLNFFEAMKLAAGHIFIKYGMDALSDGKKVLLIEDGGYLAPLLNDFACQGLTAVEVFQHFHVEQKTEGLFSEWLLRVMIGSVEHTKNGYDRLQHLAEKHTRLLLPAYSIAVSRDKTVEESQEVAQSILSAVESVLHGQGMVLSQRKVMVLGADGNIGRYLCRFLLDGRLHANNKKIIQVDISYATDHTAYRYPSIDAVPEDHLLSRDLFIGVIGESVLKRSHLEKIILFSQPTRLIFTSGSTKTVEFSDLSEWLYALSDNESPRIKGVPVEIEYDRIVDPQSDIDQGGKVIIRFRQDGRHVVKELYLLSNLSPVNFLFYGVPTETMDMVLSQLLKVSLGMNHQNKAGNLPAPGLYAVDKEIDAWGDTFE